MHVVCISDTHTRHARLTVPPCDLLIHAGDLCRKGSDAELDAFVEWFAAQPATDKVFIAGNEDACCERNPERVHDVAAAAGVTYLDEEEIVIQGLRIYGSPVTPKFFNMAFNRERGPEIRRHWDAIPEGIDILITHGPPQGILDRIVLGRHVGCADLLERVHAVRPRLHVFGHIHEARGKATLPGLRTQFVNAANARLLPIAQRGPMELHV
ncbi:MAG: metallophosphatase domain-containing protein [Myxococcota bacterium]